jgi:lantibiotic leader peptide-processing serine protease
MEASVGRRNAVFVVAMLCAVPLIMLAAGVVRAQSAAEDAGNTEGTEKTYIVLYKQEAVPAGSAGQVQAAGGSTVATYGQIGVVVARSDSASFASTLGRDARIDAVADASELVYKVDPVDASSHNEQEPELPNAPATDADTFSPLQWDMRQIFAPEAHEITGGSPEVVAATIDTGLDFTHPDLAANYDPTHSADCTSGVPAPLPPGNDANGHGTHTAGTIAADDNGVGIVGVAPNVKIAGIKAGNNDGYFFPQAVICAFMFADSTHVDVTNNSYFADPFLYNCHNNAAQQAIIKA